MLDLVLGGSAAVVTCLMTNPFEVIKTRLQLQGELQRKGTYQVIYKNTFQAWKTMIRYEGFRGLYRGIVPAMWFQFVYYGARFGSYEFASDNGFIVDAPTSRRELLPIAFAASLGGTVGAICGSPFQMIKVRMQAKSAAAIAVGYQHMKMKGMFSGFFRIAKNKGIRGLYSGLPASIVKSFISTGVQTIAFLEWRHFLADKHLFQESSLWSSFLTINTTAILLSFILSPFDVVLTRMYNQGLDQNCRGMLYDNLPNCVEKIFKHEGIKGFYKGLLPSYIRVGPHSSLVVVFFETFKSNRDYLNFLYPV